MNSLIVLLSLITTTVVSGFQTFNKSGNVLATVDYLLPIENLGTNSSFIKKEIIEREVIRYGTQYIRNPNLEVEVEKITQEGLNGERTNFYGATYWQGKLTEKKLSRSEVKQPENRIVEIGTKYYWKENNINGSNIKYWKKMNVWATSYDANCLGCSGRTYTGTAVILGTCAVDPRLIKLGSRFYVPGYGLCRAEDIGGAIKGKKIDLGFPSVKEGFWSARNVDIYLLDGEPTN